MARNRRLAIFAAIAAGGIGAVALDRVMPPDMSRWQECSTILLADDGRPLNVLPAADGQYRLRVDPRDVDPAYLRLLVAAEDKRFFTHPGVDPLAMVRAMGQWVVSGHVVSGGSTLTMQVARLLEPRPRTVIAKLWQVGRALQLERRYDKREILSMYLTLAPFGGNVEGVRMASLSYFNREPRALTPAQAALLAVLPRSPERLRPDRHPAHAKAAVGRLLTRLEAASAIPADFAAAAAAEPLPQARQVFHLAPHLAQRLAKGSVGQVPTTLNADLQRRLETLARDEAAWLRDGGIAILVADVADRRVRAWVGSSGLNFPQGHVDMVVRPRSPGSALKPLIYAMAIDEHQVHPETVVDDRPVRFGGYMPRNFDREYQGRVTIREALQASLNMPAVAVLERLGSDHFLKAMSKAGITMELPQAEGPPGLAIALGGVGITLNDLVTAYAALASDGHVVPLTVITGRRPRPPVRLVSRNAAAAVTGILADAPRPPFVAVAEADNRRIAFKTGTSYGYRDAWAIGWTNRHVVGVWVGRPDGTPRPGAMGRTVAAPILFAVMDMLGRTKQSPSTAVRDAPREHTAPAGLRELPTDADPVSQGLGIVFPVANGTIETLPVATGGLPPVPLQASGGRLPYRWYVDGMPLSAAHPGYPVEWRPGGEGFARITVVDADGRSASVMTRLKMATGDSMTVAPE